MLIPFAKIVHGNGKMKKKLIITVLFLILLTTIASAQEATVDKKRPTIVVTFEEPVIIKEFSLSNASEQRIAITLILNVSNTTFKLTPDSSLANGSIYTFSVRANRTANNLEKTLQKTFLVAIPSCVSDTVRISDTRRCSNNTGGCREGTQTCMNDGWSECAGAVWPSPEICDGFDNDCNGIPDDAVGGCECTIGQTQPCGIGLGICVKGTQSCINGKWSAECTGTVWPLPEACDGVDNDCNGIEDDGCSCTDGQTQECGSDVPICRKGTSRCANGQWNSTCENAVLPVPEACDNLDNDCNGETDTGCPCRPIDSTQICGINVGECREGRQTCTALGWGSCAGDVRPANETCDGRDNDCDGKIDNGCPLGIFILEPQNGVSKTQIFNITISISMHRQRI